MNPLRGPPLVVAFVRMKLAGLAKTTMLAGAQFGTPPKDSVSARIAAIVAIDLVMGLFAALSPAVAAETFRQLKGKEITARFSGMEFSDDVHWAYVFVRDGSAISYSMGSKSFDRWHVDKDGLCIDSERAERRCYQVWVAGNNVQFRPIGVDVPLEGVLTKPKKRSP
jgi:hypothetical protein